MLKGYDPLLNIVLDEAEEFLRGEQVFMFLFNEIVFDPVRGVANCHTL